MSNFESNKNTGWIHDYRSIMNWGWYKTPLTAHLFMHCVRKANRCDSYFQGTLVKRGSFITSYEKLAYETGLTVNQVRTSLDNHLLVTGELRKKTSNKFTVITVVNYDEYQGTDSIEHSRQNHKQTTNKPQAGAQTNHKPNHKQTTIKSQSNHNKQEYENKRRCVCPTGTHTPRKEKTAPPPVAPLGGARRRTVSADGSRSEFTESQTLNSRQTYSDSEFMNEVGRESESGNTSKASTRNVSGHCPPRQTNSVSELYDEVGRKLNGVNTSKAGMRNAMKSDASSEAVMSQNRDRETPAGATCSPPLSPREWRTYSELKGHNEYDADEFWVKQKGIFDEKQKRTVREFLKANGEPVNE